MQKKNCPETGGSFFCARTGQGAAYIKPGDAADTGKSGTGPAQGGMPQGGGQDADEYAYIRISGGTVRIVTGGDGADSNGKLTVAGGALYVSGPENGANGALDYGTDAVITGGTVCAPEHLIWQ